MTTEQTIERSIILGLVRVFSEHGWPVTRAPRVFDRQVSYIIKGLKEGKMPSYEEHLKKIMKHCRKKNAYTLYSADYLDGLVTLMHRYGNTIYKNHGTSKINVTWKLEPKIKGNIFINDPNAHKALSRLRRFGKTNINYAYVERYGLKKLTDDIREAGYPEAVVYVNTQDHVPNEIFDGYAVPNDDSLVKVYVYMPIMPLLLVSYVQ